MSQNYPGSLQGQFLIAMPSLADPHFALTVTYLCVHNADGAFGLVINQVFGAASGKTIFDELDITATTDIESIPIHLGGPVHQGHVFVLHGPPLDWEASLIVTDMLAMSNSMDILQAIADNKGPKSYILVLGCAGWAPGQLEAEMAENSWLTCPGSEEIIFTTPIEERWEKAAQSIGVDLNLLTETPGHA